jgi:hypothetical protein
MMDVMEMEETFSIFLFRDGWFGQPVSDVREWMSQSVNSQSTVSHSVVTRNNTDSQIGIGIQDLIRE